MDVHSSSSDIRWRHLGFALGIGMGVIIGAVIERIYGKKRKKDDLTNAIRALSDQVSQLNEIISNVNRDNQTESKKVITEDYGGGKKNCEVEEEDGDVFFEFAPSKETTNITSRDAIIGINERLNESEILREGTNENREQSFKLLLELSQKFESNAEIFWRLGRAQYDMAMLAGKEENIEAKQEFMKKAIETCKKAVEMDDNNALAHKWYGIALGNYVQFVGSQEKIALGYKYKEHIERAIELNPQDPSAYSLLGRWCYEVSMLPWYLRKIAAAVYGEPPNSSVDEALGYAMKAEDLKPNFWKENSLLIGKCYYQKSDYNNAKEWLERASTLPIKNEDDEIAQKEIEDLLLKV